MMKTNDIVVGPEMQPAGPKQANTGFNWSRHKASAAISSFPPPREREPPLENIDQADVCQLSTCGWERFLLREVLASTLAPRLHGTESGLICSIRRR